MRSLLIFWLAILILPLSGCDIFIGSFGDEHMPCRETGDCHAGRECEQQTCVDVKRDSGHHIPDNDRGLIESLSMSSWGDQGVWLATSADKISGSNYAPRIWKITSIDDVTNVRILSGEHNSPINSVSFLFGKYELLAADGDSIQIWTGILDAPAMTEVSTAHQRLFAGFSGSWTLIANQENGYFKLVNDMGDPTPVADVVHSHGEIYSVAFHPFSDPPIFVTAGDGLTRWSCADGSCSQIDDVETKMNGTAFNSVSFRQDGSYLAAILFSENELKILNEQMDVEFVSYSYDQQYTTLAYSPVDNMLLAVGREDGAIEIWHAETPDYNYLDKVLYDLESPVKDIVFSHGGDYLAASGDKELVIYEVSQIFNIQE